MLSTELENAPDLEAKTEVWKKHKPSIKAKKRDIDEAVHWIGMNSDTNHAYSDAMRSARFQLEQVNEEYADELTKMLN